MNKLNTFTKITLSLGLILLIYGIIARLVPVYFFWESTQLSITVILIGIISLLSNIISARKLLKQKSLLLKISIGFLCFFLFIQSLTFFIIPNTDAYEVAKNHIRNNDEIKSEIGKIVGFGFMVTGSISKQSSYEGETGQANINMIVKGEKKYKSVLVVVAKGYDTGWIVMNVY